MIQISHIPILPPSSTHSSETYLFCAIARRFHPVFYSQTSAELGAEQRAGTLPDPSGRPLSSSLEFPKPSCPAAIRDHLGKETPEINPVASLEPQSTSASPQHQEI
jgi:hypothetical protein